MSILNIARISTVAASVFVLGCGSTDATNPSLGGECVADDDGVITELELQAVAGASDKFLRATGVPVDTAGSVANGLRVWDFAGPYAGDASVVSTLEPIVGKWFAGDFPGASYAWWLESEDLYGVYRASAGSVALLGYASKTNEPGTLSLTHYDPPVLVFRAPLSTGDSWQTTARLTGSSPFGPVDFTDGYAVTVDARGSMIAPAGSLPVLRVNVLATRDDAGDTEAHRQQYYLTECRGIVGAVVSETLDSGEPPPDFSAADEVARLQE